MYDGTELAALQEEEEKQNLEQEDEEHGQFVPLRFDSASLNRDPDGWLPSEQQGEEAPTSASSTRLRSPPIDDAHAKLLAPLDPHPFINDRTILIPPYNPIFDPSEAGLSFEHRQERHESLPATSERGSPSPAPAGSASDSDDSAPSPFSTWQDLPTNTPEQITFRRKEQRRATNRRSARTFRARRKSELADSQAAFAEKDTEAAALRSYVESLRRQNLSLKAGLFEAEASGSGTAASPP